MSPPARVNSATLDTALHRAADALAAADAVIVCAGAGMSVDSGIPDYRSQGGFWRGYAPLQALQAHQTPDTAEGAAAPASAPLSARLPNAALHQGYWGTATDLVQSPTPPLASR